MSLLVNEVDVLNRIQEVDTATANVQAEVTQNKQAADTQIASLQTDVATHAQSITDQGTSLQSAIDTQRADLEQSISTQGTTLQAAIDTQRTELQAGIDAAAVASIADAVPALRGKSAQVVTDQATGSAFAVAVGQSLPGDTQAVSVSGGNMSAVEVLRTVEWLHVTSGGPGYRLTMPYSMPDREIKVLFVSPSSAISSVGVAAVTEGGSTFDVTFEPKGNACIMRWNGSAWSFDRTCYNEYGRPAEANNQPIFANVQGDRQTQIEGTPVSGKSTLLMQIPAPPVDQHYMHIIEKAVFGSNYEDDWIGPWIGDEDLVSWSVDNQFTTNDYGNRINEMFAAAARKYGVMLANVGDSIGITVVSAPTGRNNDANGREFLLTRMSPTQVQGQIMRASIWDILTATYDVGVEPFGQTEGETDATIWMTCDHVTSGGTGTRIVMQDGTVLPATLLAANQEYDVALLATGAVAGLSPVTIESQWRQTAPQGSPVVILGSPWTDFMAVTSGVVSDSGSLPYFMASSNSALATRTFLVLDAVSRAGNSGGLVAKSDGTVIGMVAFGPSHQGSASDVPVDTLSYAVPGWVMASMLARWQSTGTLSLNWAPGIAFSRRAVPLSGVHRGFDVTGAVSTAGVAYGTGSPIAGTGHMTHIVVTPPGEDGATYNFGHLDGQISPHDLSFLPAGTIYEVHFDGGNSHNGTI